MGTRFIATREAPGDENVKNAIVAASELDTRLVMPGSQHRACAEDASVERLLEIDAKRGALTIADLMTRNRGSLSEGDDRRRHGGGAWSCGHGAGLISRCSQRQGIDRPDHARGR